MLYGWSSTERFTFWKWLGGRDEAIFEQPNNVQIAWPDK